LCMIDTTTTTPFLILQGKNVVLCSGKYGVSL